MPLIKSIVQIEINAACVQQYFSDSNSEDIEEDNLADDPIYKEILDSKSADEALVRMHIVLVLFFFFE